MSLLLFIVEEVIVINVMVFFIALCIAFRKENDTTPYFLSMAAVGICTCVALIIAKNYIMTLPDTVFVIGGV